MVDESELLEFYEDSRFASLHSLWVSFYPYEKYQEAIDNFLFAVKYFVKTDKFLLAENNKRHLDFILPKEDIEKHISLFKKSFPEENRMKEIGSYWFYIDECPYMPVWFADKFVEGWVEKGKDGQLYFWT